MGGEDLSMGWVRLDDTFPQHPKVVGLSLEARWAFIESICYAARYRTDGLIPDVVAANGPVRQELLASGLWENGTAAVMVHDYLQWNLSREDAEALSIERSRAGARGGASRTANAQANAQANAEPNAQAKSRLSRPVPVTPKSKAYDPSWFDQFWTIYPRKVGKPQAVAAFRKALDRASLDEVLVGARRYREDPNRDDTYTAHPTTWLNRDGWNDDQLPPRSQPVGRPPDPPRPLIGSEGMEEVRRELYGEE